MWGISGPLNCCMNRMSRSAANAPAQKAIILCKRRSPEMPNQMQGLVLQKAVGGGASDHGDFYMLDVVDSLGRDVRLSIPYELWPHFISVTQIAAENVHRSRKAAGNSLLPSEQLSR